MRDSKPVKTAHVASRTGGDKHFASGQLFRLHGQVEDSS